MSSTHATPSETHPERRLTVILNPAAGRGAGRKRRGELETALTEVVKRQAGRTITWRIMETARPGDGTLFARQAVEEGADIVAAAGGDGTLGEVLNGIAGSTATLGLIPLGTGNDFARQLGISHDLTLAVDILICGIPRPVDLGRTQDRWFINVAGCGFDAIVAQRAPTRAGSRS